VLELFQSMAWPFVACLVLTGIHVYLGIHVIERRVVFVDLALAQIAAFGSVWGVLLGWSLESDSWEVKSIALGFSVIGAAIFALTRTKHERIPHEAVIGIIYAVALAGTVLASANLAHGAEEVRMLLSGSILWVTKETVLWTAGLYLIVGLVHWLFRKPFFELSMVTSGTTEDGECNFDTRARLWDFLFYVTFGLVVTSSVSIGGVLLVFSYLVIPAVSAMLFTTGIRARLFFGWMVASLMSALGIYISYENDLPSGPTIVVCLGAFLALAGLVHHIQRSPTPAASLLRSMGLSLIPIGFLGLTWYLKPVELTTLDHRLASPSAEERLQAVLSVLENPELEFEASPYLPDLLVDSNSAVRRQAFELVIRRPQPELLEIVADYLEDADDLWREESVRVLRRVGDRFCVDALYNAASTEYDLYLKTEMAEALLELEDQRGINLLIDLMDTASSALIRDDAWNSLQDFEQLELEFDSSLGADENDAEVQAIREFLIARAD